MKEAPVASRKVLEYLRFRAVDLKEKGWKQTEIAEALGVVDSTVSMWLSAARKKGLDALKMKKCKGPSTKLSPEQEQQLKIYLQMGAETFGFVGDYWTSKRIVTFIQHAFDVHFHRASISKIMKRLGFSYQAPTKVSSQKDEQKARQWLSEHWPALKKKLKMKDVS